MQLLKNLTKALETIVQNYTENTDFEIDLTKFLKGLIVYSAKLIGVPDEVASVFKGYFHFTSGTNMDIVRRLEVEPKVELMLESLNAILEDIRKKSGSLPIMLVDGLDNLRDMDAIKLMFVEKQFLNRPICNVVYVGPLDLFYSAEVGNARFRFKIVPYANIKIFSRGKSDNIDEQGRQIMTDVVSRRLKSLRCHSR